MFPLRIKEKIFMSFLVESPAGILGLTKVSYDSYLLLFSKITLISVEKIYNFHSNESLSQCHSFGTVLSLY